MDKETEHFKTIWFFNTMHVLKNVKNMVYEKLAHNFKTLNIFIYKNMPKSDIHPTWFKQTPIYVMVNHFV
jgi:hypothetical protein